MSPETQLRRGLRTLAGEAPSVVVPADFFAGTRKRAKQRRAVRLVAVVVALLTLGVGFAFRPGGTGPVAGGGHATTGLPRTLRVPPFWTGLVDQSPPGTAAAIFGGDATVDNWNEGRFAVVSATGDRYRVFNEFTYTGPGFDALLSPDGNLIARNRVVRSLQPEKPFSVVLPGDPRAFSPDGKLLVYETGDGTTFVDGASHRESRIGVFDLERRTEVASIDNADNLDPVAVALSPDNTRLAVQVRDKIRIYRLDRPAPSPYAELQLDAETLAGPGAWRPDGRSFVTARRTADNTWRLVPHDAETGAALAGSTLPDITQARYVHVIGWRADGTAVAVTGVPKPSAAPAELFGVHPWVPYVDSQTVRARLVSLTPGASAPAVLLETPPGVSELDVAADLAIAGQFRDAGPPDYGPLAPAALAAAVVLAVLVVVLAPLVWLGLRRRRR